MYNGLNHFSAVWIAAVCGIKTGRNPMTKEEINYRMKQLARKFCKRNNVYTEFDSSVGKLVEKAYLSAYLLCLHENKNKIAELAKARKLISNLLYVYQLGKNELAIARVRSEAEEFLKEIDV